MSEISDQVRSHIAQHQAGPFLFLGSGFSRRYLQLDDWVGLLSRFAAPLKPIEYYLSKSGNNVPKAASFLAEDFHEYWWKDPEAESDRKTYRELVTNVASPLKIAIARYLKGLDYSQRKDGTSDELAALARTNVDGIITTNWDLLAEAIFPDYRVYVGQESLLTSQPSSIAEIYKIHGCCSRPNSLVLTGEDYSQFHERQAYLAAKLLTIFVEHPVIFIGYSLNDPNIQSILKAVVRGIGGSAVERLQNNLMFVYRSKEDRPQCFEKGFFSVGDVQLPIVKITADTFLDIFDPLNQLRRKLPSRVLRFCREQLYSVVNTTDPHEKLCILDYDELDKHSDVEFVVGVGVTSQIGTHGYTQFSKQDLFSFLLKGEPNLDPRKILDATLPALCPPKANHFLPVYVFMRRCGTSPADAVESALPYAHLLRRNDPMHFRTQVYGKQFKAYASDLSTKEIITQFQPEKAASLLAWQSIDRMDINEVRDFLVDNFDLLFEGPYSTHFRKLACLYDYLAFK